MNVAPILKSGHRPVRPHDPWRQGEPTLAEAMGDPIVHLLMRRDGLVPEAVWPQMLAASDALRSRLCRMTRLAA